MSTTINPVVLTVVSVLCLLAFAWSVWDVVRRPHEQIAGGSKLLWIVVFVLFTPLSQIVYVWLERRRGERS
jgi:hypothetical protein